MSRTLLRSLQGLSRARGSVTRPQVRRSSSSSARTAGDWLAPIAAGAFVFTAAVYAERNGYLPNAGALSKKKTRYANPEELDTAIQELKEAFPDKNRVQTNPDALSSYGQSPHSYYPGASHSVIVSVLSTEDVVKVVNISRKYKVPIVPYASATSLEGHYNGVRGFTFPLVQVDSHLFRSLQEAYV